MANQMKSWVSFVLPVERRDVQLQKASATFSHSEVQNTPGGCNSAIFPRAVFGNLKTNTEHMQNKFMAGSTKEPSFLAIFYSLACLHCWRTLGAL